MARLARRGREPFSLVVLVDQESLNSGTPYCQRSRLNALRGETAVILACRGGPPNGIFHKKALIVDRRYMYTGGANFTNKSERNGELVFRTVGPPVAEVLADLAGSRARGVEWEGLLHWV